MSKKVFKEDWRKDNPALHLFYVKTAIIHLKTIDEILTKLSNHANGNLLSMLFKIQKEQEVLIKENAAYYDAAEIFKSIHKNTWISSKLIKSKETIEIEEG